MLEPGKPLTIIMVDDDAEDAMLTKAAIEASGQRVDFHHIGSGIDLFEKLTARLEESAVCSALILLDLNMPVMDGREVLQKLRGHERFNKVPVIVVSTSSAKSDIDSCYAAGANAFVTKPVSFDRMVEAMEAIGRFWGGTARIPG